MTLFSKRKASSKMLRFFWKRVSKIPSHEVHKGKGSTIQVTGCSNFKCSAWNATEHPLISLICLNMSYAFFMHNTDPYIFFVNLELETEVLVKCQENSYDHRSNHMILLWFTYLIINEYLILIDLSLRLEYLLIQTHVLNY